MFQVTCKLELKYCRDVCIFIITRVGGLLVAADGSSAEAAAWCSLEESFSSQMGPCDRIRLSMALPSCSSPAAPFHYSQQSAASMWRIQCGYSLKIRQTASELICMLSDTEMKMLLRLHIYLAPQVHVVSLQIHLLRIKFMPHVSKSKLASYQGSKRTSVQRITEFH